MTMFRVSTRASRGLFCGAVALLSALALLMIADPADARSKRKPAKRPAAAANYEPRYSDIVVDVNLRVVLTGGRSNLRFVTTQ